MRDHRGGAFPRRRRIIYSAESLVQSASSAITFLLGIWAARVSPKGPASPGVVPRVPMFLQGLDTTLIYFVALDACRAVCSMMLKVVVLLWASLLVHLQVLEWNCD